MPPKKKISKEEIIDTSFNLIKNEGINSFNARRIAKELSCSTQPIFSSFETMKELKDKVKEKAKNIYHQYLNEGLKTEKPYKGSGLAYIKFAKEEPNLFKLIFMDDINNNYNIGINDEKDHLQTDIIMEATGLEKNDAKYIQLESWVFVHGIASLIVTNTISFDDNIIDQLLTQYFIGVKLRKEDNDGSN